MKRLTLICLSLCLAMATYAYDERNLLQKKADINTLKQLLLPKQDWVTYPNYKEREAWSELLGENKTHYISQGEKKLDYKWQVVPATAYLEFSRTGNRTIMETPLNQNIGAIGQLLLAELAEGKGRFINQIIDGIFTTCEMTSWVVSAHLINQSNRTSLPYHNEQMIDLVSGDISALLSWTHYFLKDEFDKVNPTISERMREEIRKKTLDPYMEDTNRFWWMALMKDWNGFVNNWNPWCNSNVLLSFLLIEDDKEKLAKAVYKSMQSVDKFINYTNLDGACEEGPVYWGHAAGKMYDYLQILADATGDKISIFDENIIKNMGEYIARSYVADGWVVNFADASAKIYLDYEHIYRYGKAIDSQEMMQFSAYLRSKQPKNQYISRDMYRTLATLHSSKEIVEHDAILSRASYTWYSQTEFCYISKDDVFFAAKGGYNDESHNHNDVGTFNLYVKNTPIFIDAGVGTYTRQTFSSERYDIWNMQSNYHNLPIINGYSQKNGKVYKAYDTFFDKSKNVFSLDISKAYPKEAGVNKWVRSYKLKAKSLEIHDIFDLSEVKDVNQINFMTWGKVDLSDVGVIEIRTGGQIVFLNYDKKSFDVSLETRKLDDQRLSNIWGDEIYRISLTSKEKALKGNYKFSITY